MSRIRHQRSAASGKPRRVSTLMQIRLPNVDSAYTTSPQIGYARAHTAVEPTSAAQDAFTAEVDRLSAGTVWITGG
jgi:hypothetical protein